MAARELAGKTCLVTGSSAGIGRVTAVTLAARGARVLLANRSEAKTKPVVDEIVRAGGAADFVPLDLGDLDSVRAATDLVRAKTDRLHVLVANAGVGGMRGATKQGFELQFGTNHLGHFLFVTRLVELCLVRPGPGPLLERSAPARIVIVASAAHYRARHVDWDALRKPTRTFTAWPEYQVSKLCNVLFARELARRVPRDKIGVYAVHPGVIASELWRRIPWPLRPLVTWRMRTVEEGAHSTLCCATDPELASESGRYYDASGKPKEPSTLALDDGLARALWTKSEEWTAQSVAAKA